jgi:hypothetical protein
VATKKQEMQRLIRLYKDESGEREIDMHKVALFAASKGWALPKPIDPLDRLAKEFSEAAREEIRRDAKTGRPYRANHAVQVSPGQAPLWVDIDEAPRSMMHKSLIQRREQMVGDGLQLSLDADHWNSINPRDQPIDIPLDFTLDVEWRKNTPEEDAA